MLQDSHAEVSFRPRLMHIRLKGKRAFLSLADEYKIREVRHLVGQLNIDPEIVKKHLPEL